MDGFCCFVVVLLAVSRSILSLSTAEIHFRNQNIPEGTSIKYRHHRAISFAVRPSCLKNSEVPGTRVNTTDRLRRLRLRMKASNYDAYIVPSSDEHESEFVADYDKRRQFISGFSGSAGTAVVLQETAALWTDGRYYIQAEQELDCNWILIKRDEKNAVSLDDWIIKKLTPGSSIGADAKLVSYYKWLLLKQKFEKANLTFHADSSNLIDDIWNIPQGRTPESVSHVFIHDVKYAGKSWSEKVEELKGKINGMGASCIIITALDEIAWLFNLRGQDVGYTPVFKAYALISENYLKLYMRRLKLTVEVEKYLCPKSSNHSDCIEILEYNKAFSDMEKIVHEYEKVIVSSSSSYAIVNLIPEEMRILQESPSLVAKQKVVKNPVEIVGMKNAALKDSVAIVDFVAMLDEEIKLGKHWDEMKAARMLTKYRKEQEFNQGESFQTISAFGPNGAIIHYSPQISTNRNINAKSLFLLDSGGQYLDGTTDITRTFHFGEPTDFEVEAYTRVLMGAIDVMNMVFPDNVDGTILDVIARHSLYSIGLNYLHSTGHGIGHFLSVHEGPIIIGHPSRATQYPLKPGMFLSDEPGFYARGKFGIRLETMMMVVKAHTPYKFNDQEYYTFEPVSFVPFEPKLIDLHLLSKKQKEWLNWYNMKTRNSVGLELRKQNRKRGFQWLLSKTEYIPVEECNSPGSSVSPYYLTSNVVIAMFALTVTLL